MKDLAVSSTETWRPASPASFIAPPPDRFALAGPSCRPDPRTHAYRSDLADVLLADRIFAPHYARAVECRCASPSTMVRAAPAADARAVTQLLHGEGFAVLDSAGGWAWGRCLHDDYVGYVPAETLGRVATPTHRVIAPLAPAFAAADIKAPVLTAFPIGSAMAGEMDGAFLRTDAGFLHQRHVSPIDAHASDWAAVAERLLGQPYLWGGRGGGGIDCSGLVQLALALCGIRSPRDSDLQQSLGEELAVDASPRRGDLVFMPDHVGLMADGTRLLHANAHWMAVTVEPLADVLVRLAAGMPVMRRRIAG